MKKFSVGFTLFLYILSLHSNPVWGQEDEIDELTEQSIISLLTCKPDSRNFITSFGHCSLRVTDSILNIDYVYDYGVIDMQSQVNPLDFLSQHIQANRRVTTFYVFRMNYSFFGRQIIEQPLHLSLEQKKSVFNRLNNDFSLENQRYPYHYLKNNCATQLRNAVFNCLDLRDTSLNSENRLTYRNVLRPYFQSRWIELVTDLVFGLSVDKPLRGADAAFLPNSLKIFFENSGLVKPTVDLLPKSKHSNMPLLVFIVLGSFIFIVTIADLRRDHQSKWLDITLGLLTGFSGTVLFTLWIGFDNLDIGWNFNLVWLTPTNLLVYWLPKNYFKTLGIMHFSLAISWFWLPQELNPIFLPIVITIGIRHLVVSYFKK